MKVGGKFPFCVPGRTRHLSPKGPPCRAQCMWSPSHVKCVKCSPHALRRHSRPTGPSHKQIWSWQVTVPSLAFGLGILVWISSYFFLSPVFPGGSEVKVSACNAGDPGSNPGSGRSPGEGNCNPLQYSCLESHMDRGAWWATVHGVAKSWTRLSNFTFLPL